MPDHTSQLSTARIDSRSLRIVGRWMVSFAGFPLGGVATMLLVGAVDSLPAALLGGLITGAVLGAVQSWALGRSGPPTQPWIAATAAGLLVGFGVGSAVVNYSTSLGALMVQGAISGFAVGIAQALVLRRRLGRLVVAWPPVLAASWAIGWFVTTSIGVAVDQQFIVFGTAGALVVTALTAVLPLTLARNPASAS